MSEYLPLIISFTIYLLGLIYIGLYFFKANKNMSDYFLGGRGMGSLVTALSAGASDMSSWLLMGLPGMMYSQGLISIWVCIGLFLGSFLNWTLVAYRLRTFTQALEDSITLPEYLARRFEDARHNNLLRIVSSVIILIFFTLYVSAGFVGGAKLFNGTFNIEYDVALVVGAFIIIFYTFLGGYLAVSWTDVIQGLLVCFALLLFPMIMLYEMPSISDIASSIKRTNPNHLNMFSISTFSIISYMSWGLGYFGQPHILARFMSIRSSDEIPKSMAIGMTWMFLILLGSLSSAFLGIAYIEENRGIINLELNDPEHIIIYLNRLILNPWLGGIIISAIMAAIMSTIDSQLLVSASSVSNDLYAYFYSEKITEEKELWLSRATVLGLAFISCLLALNPESKILEMVAYAWAGFGATFGPVVLFSLFYRKTTHKGVLAGLIVGALTVVIWQNLEKIYPGYEIFHIYEILPGFIFASLSIYIVSNLDKNKVSKEITEKIFTK